MSRNVPPKVTKNLKIPETFAECSRKFSIVYNFGCLQAPILVSNRLLLQSLFPGVVTYRGFDWPFSNGNNVKGKCSLRTSNKHSRNVTRKFARLLRKLRDFRFD